MVMNQQKMVTEAGSDLGFVTSLPGRALTLWRKSLGMLPEHLAREMGWDEWEVVALEEGHRGLSGRTWAADQLRALGAPRWALDMLSRTPDCRHITTHRHITTLTGITGRQVERRTIICARCGWLFGEDVS